MRSTTMNATTTENRVPNAAAQELDDRNLEAVTGGIIIVGGFDPMRFQTVMPSDVYVPPNPLVPLNLA